jgi:HEAT repeat protein/uncharacterized protein YndB with AHSA1/START domain
VRLFKPNIIKMQVNKDSKGLIKALQDNDCFTRRAAASMLGSLKESNAIEPLKKSLNDSDENVQTNAAESLGMLGDNSGIEFLTKILFSEKLTWDDRREVLKRLRRIAEYGNQRALTPIVTCLSQGSSPLGSLATIILKEIGVPAITPLISSLKEPNITYGLGGYGKFDTRRYNINILMDISLRIGDIQAIEPLILLLDEPNSQDKNFKDNILETLKKFRNDKAINAVENYLKSPKSVLPASSTLKGRVCSSADGKTAVTVQTIINRSPETVWEFIVQASHWKQWNGVGLKSAEWKIGGRLYHEIGGFSTIVEPFSPPQKLQYHSDGMWSSHTTFALNPDESGKKTNIMITEEYSGVTLTDRGASKQESLESILTKLKDLIEKEPEKELMANEENKSETLDFVENTNQSSKTLSSKELFYEKDNLGTRQDTTEKAISYWKGRRWQAKKEPDPFVLYTFKTEKDAKAALLELSCIHEAKDTGNLICTETLDFGYYNLGSEYEAIICGVDLSHELWEIANASFAKHGGIKKNDLEPKLNTKTITTEVPSDDQVIFLREDRVNDAFGLTIYRVFKGPNAASAKAFLQKQQVTKKLYFIVVETSEGNYGKDINGIYKE